MVPAQRHVMTVRNVMLISPCLLQPRVDDRCHRHYRSVMTSRRSGYSSIVAIVYVVIGLIVASGHAFFAHLDAVMPILSAILAVLLWPLVLLGVDLHLR
jgi:hypothetical protein